MKQLITFCSFLFFCANLSAQEFYTTVSSKSIALNQNVKVTYTLKDAKGKGFKRPNFADFQIVAGPSTSSNMQIVNGNMSRSNSWTFTLRPKKMGQLTIEGASVQVKGKSMSSNAVTIKVGEKSEQIAKQQNGGFTDAELRERVFVRLMVSKNNLYVGEQLTATVKLYAAESVADAEFLETPTYPDFWKEDLNADKKWKQEVIDGARYNTAILEKVALFPQRAGELTISPMKLNANIQVKVRNKPRNSFEAMFGHYQVKEIPLSLNSGAAKIQVKALPSAGKPAGFNGAVGQFSFSADVDQKNTETDNPVTFKVKLSGTGNLRSVDLPVPTLPPNFEIFDPQANRNVSKAGGIVKGTLKADYLIVPRHPGEFEIPPLSFSYFDPKQEKYIMLSTDAAELTVTGEISSSTDITASGLNKQEVELLAEDIRYIKTDIDGLQERSQKHLLAGNMFYLLYASPWVLLLGLFFVKKRADDERADAGSYRKKKASSVARKRLAKAAKLLHETDSKLYYKELELALWQYASDKFGIAKSAITIETVQHAFAQVEMDESQFDDFAGLISKAEMALYAPISQQNKEADHQKAIALIASLEKGSGLITMKIKA